MNKAMPSVLFVDDDSDALLSLIRALRAAGAEAALHAATTADKALQLMSELRPQVAVLDLSLDERRGVESGFELLSQLRSFDPTCRVILLTGHGSTQYGVRALSLGAASFLEKPANIAHLLELIRDGIAQSELRRSYNNLLEGGSRELSSFLVGSSASMDKVRDAVGYAAQTTQPVLLTGETGTGKGLCAQAIHRFGIRRERRFVKYQPGFGAPDLVNSALFGHLKGAFTGAGDSRTGLLLEAHLGTFFLDEVDELPLATQVSLLGVLQDGKFRPLGCDTEREVNFRLICASNQNIESSLEAGKIRQDFYHRVAHFRIDLPPLRERAGDIGQIAETVLAKLRDKEGLNVFEMAQGSFHKLTAHNWPGNVRELEAVMEGAAFRAHFAGRSCLEETDIQLPGSHADSGSAGDFHSQVMAFKLRTIEEALRRNAGSQVKAAHELRLDRSTMRRLLAR